MNPNDGTRCTWLVYARDDSGPGVGLSYVGQAYGNAEDAFQRVARNENLLPAKYLALSSDLVHVATATITHRVVLDA